MNEALPLILALLTGALLGLLFFGGLWWTIRRGLASKRSAFWFFGSLLLRTSVVVVGFRIAGGGHWQRMLACLLGFVIGRLVVTWLVRDMSRPASVPQEVGHAP